MTRLELFVNLGYKRDPFKDAVFATADGLRVMRILTMAVESQAMVCICGERGIGKSKAITAALSKLGVHQVHVTRGQKERITIGDIECALVLDLAPDGESPKRGGEARSRQVRRIVGEVSRKRKIVLVIEEAHRMHSSTLRSLKTLREIQWMGNSELFSVVLVGQSDPMSRAGVSEVRLRTDVVRMNGLSQEEAAGYLCAVLPNHFTDEVAMRVAALSAARNFLELQERAVALLNLALADGREGVSLEDVAVLAGREQEVLPRSGRAAERKRPAAKSGDVALRSVLGRRAAADGVDGDENDITQAV
ncbi:ATP-binding protein [Chrysiogenes arsenatis]|uniref:ATP-binding protein n=1 Tax=Chrysiogenes arsenatis TaxID=309797 RepID=UPI00048526F3|nr:ATP-binding protein [Chrysiogenes arsenatis]